MGTTDFLIFHATKPIQTAEEIYITHLPDIHNTEISNIQAIGRPQVITDEYLSALRKLS